MTAGKCTVKRRKRKKGLLKKAGILLMIVGIILIAALSLFEIYMRPVIKKLLDYKCRVTAERIISDAVFETLSGEAEKYGDIISFSYDNSGKITALKTDQIKINSLKSLLNGAVNKGIAALSGETIGISLGTLSGISFLYGTGGSLKFNVEPKGSADTRLSASFKNAGINQTIHSMILSIEAELSPMIPGFYEGVEISYDIMLSQTVIVGEVPGSYSNVILDEEYYSELADLDIM